mmetsp:Transcript_14786/g.23315  ORF Transcript_14786/g.23315 Transcript_14786/m.23315 type:complete len:602 (-) Transcript_14786:232-2037(-)
MRSYLAPSAPPGSLKTWRCKQAPRKLVEIDPTSVSDGAAAAIAQARGSVPNSVRLARVSPEHGHHLDEACTVGKEPMPPLRVSFEENHPWSVATASEWPRSVPLAPRSRDLDFSCFSSRRTLGMPLGKPERPIEVVELHRRWQVANNAVVSRLQSRDCHAVLLAWQHCVMKRRLNTYEDVVQALEIRHDALVVELEDLNRASVEAEGRQAALAEATEQRHAIELATAHAYAERSMTEARSAMARHSRDLALGHGLQLARQTERMSELTVFSAWRHAVARARLESKWQSRLHEVRLSSGSWSLAGSSEVSGAVFAKRYQSRDCAWASAMHGMLAKAVVASWRTAVQQKRVVSTIQAKLFAEEAQRTALLVAQRTENDAKLLEMETRHRAAVQCVRSELAEVEAKHSESLSLQEKQMAVRLAAYEADFSKAINAALQASDRQASQVIDGSGIQNRSDGDSKVGEDPRITEALRVLRQRGEQRAMEAETRHAEILHAREEEARVQLLEVERRAMEEAEEREALARREMERRVRDLQEQLGAALEAQHTESDIRLIEAETRYQERLHFQQDAFNERYGELARRYEEVLQVLKDMAPLSLHPGDVA